MASRPGPPRPIVVCGHLCLDVIPGFFPSGKPREYFKPGTLTIVGAPAISTGGAVPNVGISLHRLGNPVRLCARIGDDLLGTLVKARLEESPGDGAAQGVSAARGEATSFTVVLNPPGIDRIFLHCPGANDGFTDADVPDEILDGAAILHFGYPTLMRGMFEDGGMRLSRLLLRARERGIITCLDVSLPDPDSDAGRVDWDAYLSRVLPLTDLFVPNAEEARLMLGGRGAGKTGGLLTCLGELAGAAFGKGARAVMIKCGAGGVYLASGPSSVLGIDGWVSRELFSPAFRARHVAGTTGAGDAAVAGLLASVSRGLPAETSLTMAAAVGTCCVEEPNATTGVLSWGETVARVEAGWERGEPPLPERGWTPCSDGLWRGPRDG